ncbi:MAG: sensor histidine kinase [Nannocystaceae bacterium]
MIDRSALDPSLRASFASLRGWLIAPAVHAEEAAAFAEYTRELTARFWPGLGLVLGVAALAWWPIDGLVYAESQGIRETFAEFRLRIFVLDVGFALVLPRVAFARRHAHAAAWLAGLANLLLAGWFIAAAGEGAVMWLYYAFMTPVFSVLLLVPLRARIAVATSFTAAIFGAWLAHPLARLDAPGATAGVSYLIFTTGLAVFIGHLLYVQVQRSFHLGRRVERQRVDLASLATRLEERVDEQTEVIRDLSARAQEVRAEQRLEFARELHDGLGQELTSMRLLVDLGIRIHTDREVLDSFTSLADQIHRIQGSLRQVLVSLSPQPLEDGSLVESLAVLVGELERRSGLECRFVHRHIADPLPPAQSLALFRIAQEGLTNALRHARARRLELRLELRGDEITLEVHDDGQGIDAAAIGRGFGTRGIQDRASALGGRATWTVDGGTHLRVTLPLRRDP